MKKGDEVILTEDIPVSWLSREDCGVIIENLCDEDTYDYTVDFGDDWQFFHSNELRPINCKECEVRRLYSKSSENYFCPFCRNDSEKHSKQTTE